MRPICGEEFSSQVIEAAVVGRLEEPHSTVEKKTKLSHYDFGYITILQWKI